MPHSPQGIAILRALANDGLKIFTLKQAGEEAHILGINPASLPKKLHNLAKEGWISRLKRGLYCFNAKSGFGSPPHDFEIASALVTPCAISHWTALHHHNLTEQTPNTIYAITSNGTAVPRSKDKHYQFIQVKKSQYFGLEKTWINEAQVQITDLERTLLDGLANPQYCGDFQEVLHAFQLAKSRIDLNRIIGYAMKLDTATVKRLGWVLEKLGFSQKKLKPLQQLPIKGFRKLDSSGPLEGPYNKKWMIQENL